jgi:hypothetical protein
VVFRKELVVTVKRRDGRVETRRVVVDKNVGGDGGGDLVTTWAFRLICCFFAHTPAGTRVSFSFTDLDGVSRTQICISGVGAIFLSSWCVDRAPYIGFGSSNTAPSRDDYRLISEVGRVRGSTIADETTFTCNIGGSWTPDSDVTVCEVGLYMLVCDSSNVARYVLFDRSVLDPCVSVGAGETISVVYAFRF